MSKIFSFHKLYQLPVEHHNSEMLVAREQAAL